MRVWWLRGYINEEWDLQYPAFITYGECMAIKAQEKLKYLSHTFKVFNGRV